jgi:hypothetical protein
MGRPNPPRRHSEQVQGQRPAGENPQLAAMQIEGRSIDPNIVAQSPIQIGLATANRMLLFHQNANPRMSGPQNQGGYQPSLPVDYSKRAGDLRVQRSENPYQFIRNPSVDVRFWSRMHSDYYYKVLFKSGQRGSSPPIFQHKWVQRTSLDNLNNPDIHRLVADLDACRLLPLMTFQHNWNDEIICQFYATLWIDSQNLVLHWLTQGIHYRCDYRTFSRLLGFTAEDRGASSLFDIFLDSVSHDDLEAAEVYKSGVTVDFTTTHLKSYFYVLNNLICLTLDPKIGDSIHLMLDAPKVLCCFGTGGDRFSITDFMWRKIEQAANDPHKSVPYAPYLMYIIEQVVGRSFHHNTVHKSYSVRHLGPRGIGGGSVPSPTRGPTTRTSSRGAYRGGTAPAPTRSSSERRRRGGGVIKYALGKLWEAFCYKTEKDDRRLRRIEQHLQIDPPESPLREF